MSFQEKRAIVSLISTIVITAGYTAVMLERYPVQAESPYAPEIFHFWGMFFVLLIPATIVVRIFMGIVTGIANGVAGIESESDITDERDRLFELKSTLYTMYVFSGVFMLAMVSLALQQPPSVMFILLLAGGVCAEIVYEVSQFIFYRRGF